MKIFIATKNKNKLKELERILIPMGFDVLSENDLDKPLPEVEETGESASDDGGGTEPDVTVAASAENSGENDGDKKTTAES